MVRTSYRFQSTAEGKFTQTYSDGIITCTATEDITGLTVGKGYASGSIGLIIGHKYITYFKLKSSASNQFTACLSNNTNGQTTLQLAENVWTQVKIYSNISELGFGKYVFCMPNSVSTGDTFSVKEYSVIDLTKMFGSGKEPSTVAEFEKMFPLSYYAYNEGEIINLNATGIKTVGFNAYNHTTGKAVLLGGKQYQISGTYTSVSYTDINGNEETITPDSDGIFTPISNGTLTVTGGNSTNTCVHLVWSGVRNGEYEPYEEHTREIPISKINTDGTITDSAEGKTRLFPDGLCRAGSVYDEITSTKAIKRVGKVDLGALTWTYSGKSPHGNLDYFKATLSDSTMKNVTDAKFNGLNDKLDIISWGDYYRDDVIKTKSLVYAFPVANKSLIVVYDGLTIPSDLSSILSGSYLYYELATPIEVVFSEPKNLDYQVNDFGTEQLLPENDDEPVTAPLTMDVTYGLNVVDFVRNADKNFVSKESMENFLTALGTEMGGTWAMTWNATTGKYDFAFTATPEPEPESEPEPEA